jgi:hypothetical protein
MKAPSANIQIPMKLQAPSFKQDLDAFCFVFGCWNFSGAWVLELGGFPA